MALRRSITAGCATALEPSDDTDNSAADFAVTTPNPRPNSVLPTETTCGSPMFPGGQQPGGSGTAKKKKKCKKRKRSTPAPGTGSGPTYPAPYAAKKKCKKKRK
jgi:hypothetical protein